LSYYKIAETKDGFFSLKDMLWELKISLSIYELLAI